MLSYIALLPGLLALYVARQRSVQHAFLYIYLPTLLLLPDYYFAITPGVPDPTFNQSASIALFFAFLKYGGPGYRFSLTDLLVATYAFSVAYSQFQATDYAEAQNLMFFQMTSVLFPYILAKSLIEPSGLRMAFAKQLVICALIVLLFNLYENKFGMNFWQRVLQPFFPEQGRGWVTTFRFGLARASGPYGHALLAGIIMVVAYRLQRWLHWSNAWPATWPRNLRLPLSPASTITMGTALALLTTFAKGSWLAAFIAAGIPIIGRARQRVVAMSAVLTLLVVVGIPVVVGFLQWASVGRMHARTDNQETAAYRYELITEYLDIANLHLWFGWGMNQWPRVANMPSIDNFFLLLYLMHGIIACTVFLLIAVSMIVRLTTDGMRQPPSNPPGSCLAFTLASIFLAYLIAAATVYMGMQTVPLLFMVTGWAESYLMRPFTVLAVEPRFSFRRVV